jgi:hypothetical protein
MALVNLHVADPIVGHRKIELVLCICRLTLLQRFEDGRLFARRIECARRVAESPQRRKRLVERCPLPAQQVGARLASAEQLLLQIQPVVENALDQRRRNAGDVAEFLRDVEHERIGGVGREGEIVLRRRLLRQGFGLGLVG